MRIPVPIVSMSIALGGLLVMAGCAPTGGAESGGVDGAVDSCTTIASGSASDSVTIDDTDPAAPTLSFTAPLSVTTTERTIVSSDGGDVVQHGSTVLLDITMYSAASGDVAISTGHGTEQSLQMPVDEEQTLSGFVKAVECAHVGDRVVAVLAPGDAYGDSGNSDIGIGPGDSVVLLVDIVELYALATPAEWTDAPEVDLSTTPPTFELPGAPATELLTHTIEEGEGAVVAFGDSVTVNYVGKSWDTGEIFDESFSSSPATFSTAGVVEGFAAAIVGHTVGSTVIVTMPPAYGYGESTGAPTDAPLAGQTLVFVVEILEIAD